MTVESYVIYRRNDGYVGMIDGALPANTTAHTFQQIERQNGYTAAKDSVVRERKVEGSWG